MSKRAVLVYQNGIANVFKVDSFNMADYGRNAKRLDQHAYSHCIAFAQGMAAAGFAVVTAHCDLAGDIAGATWAEGIGDLWPNNKVEIRANL